MTREELKCYMSAVCPFLECGARAFSSQRALIDHIATEHNHSSNETVNHETIKSFQTTYHQSINLSDDSSDFPQPDSKSLSGSQCLSVVWECTTCKELFDTETERDVHSKQCLYNIPYECSDCKQKFTFLSALYDHIDETNCKHEKNVAKSIPNELMLTNGSLYEATLLFAGSAIPNPGNGGIGYVLVNAYGRTVEQISINLLSPNCRQNEASYCALIKGLQCANKHQFRSLLVQGDSEIVINQVGALYEIKDEVLSSLNDVVRRMGRSNFEEKTLWHMI